MSASNLTHMFICCFVLTLATKSDETRQNYFHFGADSCRYLQLIVFNNSKHTIRLNPIYNFEELSILLLAPAHTLVAPDYTLAHTTQEEGRGKPEGKGA